MAEVAIRIFDDQLSSFGDVLGAIFQKSIIFAFCAADTRSFNAFFVSSPPYSSRLIQGAKSISSWFQ